MPLNIRQGNARQEEVRPTRGSMGLQSLGIREQRENLDSQGLRWGHWGEQDLERMFAMPLLKLNQQSNHLRASLPSIRQASTLAHLSIMLFKRSLFLSVWFWLSLP